MKKRPVTWYNPANFKFTNEQRNKLKQSWGRPNDRANAEDFIRSTERIISYWLAKQKPNEDAETDRIRCSDISSAARQLHRALSNPDPDFNGGLDAHFQEKVLLDKSADGQLLRDRLHDLGGSTMRLSQIWPTLDILIPSIEQSANAYRAHLKSKPGPHKNDIRGLLYPIANIYRSSFGKPPSSSMNGSFFAFMKTLAVILNIEIGHRVIRSVLQR